jgi:hypothetical protein
MAMENDGKINPSELKIQGLLDRYLRFQPKTNEFETRAHLDEDSLTAFVEGNLSKREAQPMIAHLVDCSFCRHVTAELVKLDLAFAEETDPITAAESQPTKVSEVLSGILSRLFGTNDDAVFAHHEEEEESEEDEDKKE